MSRNPLRAALTSSMCALVLLSTGCVTSGSSTGNADDVVGTWGYLVPDAIDPMNLRQGVIQITSENGILGGTISAVHFDARPLTNVRYTYGELTFRVQSMPGQSQAVAFSLDPEGDTMVGTAYPDSGAGSVEAGSRRSGSMASTNIRLSRAN